MGLTRSCDQGLIDQFGGVSTSSTSDKKEISAVSVGRKTRHKAKKAHMDLVFAVLKAGDRLESDGKLQLTRVNNELNADTSGDSSLPCSTPCPCYLAGPYPQQRGAGQALCLKMALLYCRSAGEMLY